MSRTVEFPIAGMTCTSCVGRLTRSLRKVAGVEWVRVELRSDLATVRFDQTVASAEALVAAVVAAGYEADARDVTDAEPPVASARRRLLGRLGFIR